MPLEIERKYLLINPLSSSILNYENPALVTVLDITQFWLPGEMVLERFRESNRLWPLPSETKFTRALKFGRGLVREEIEEETSRELFSAMEHAALENRWPRVEKRRWVLKGNGYLWEIDVNADWPNMLAEVELAYPEAPVQEPEWLLKCGIRDVTDDRRYNNYVIGRNGFPPSYF